VGLTSSADASLERGNGGDTPRVHPYRGDWAGNAVSIIWRSRCRAALSIRVRMKRSAHVQETTSRSTTPAKVDKAVSCPRCGKLKNIRASAFSMGEDRHEARKGSALCLCQPPCTSNEGGPLQHCCCLNRATRQQHNR